MELEKQEAIDWSAILQSSDPDKMLNAMNGYRKLIMKYECGIMEVRTKLDVLNHEFSLNSEHNPIEYVEDRIKSPASILEKLKRKGVQPSMENITEEINDMAGIRVICSFPEDIYTIAELLIMQDDVTLLQKKDYIANPKENGYRSLHLIISVPVFLSQETIQVKVEVQFRTIAMDFWASLEHKMRYKKNIKNTEKISRELRECADLSHVLDLRMQEVRRQIEFQERGINL